MGDRFTPGVDIIHALAGLAVGASAVDRLMTIDTLRSRWEHYPVPCSLR